MKGKHGAEKSFHKKADLANKSKIASRFGQLLTSATNEIRDEEDTLYAIDQQAEEAVTVLSEWLQESQDFQLAQELATALEQEGDCQKRLELIQGEAEALRVAVEEKRRMKNEAQAKSELERADEEFARKLAADEVKYYESRNKQFEEDEKFCFELDEEEKKTSSEAKSSSTTSPAESKSGDIRDMADSKSDYKEGRLYKEDYEEKEDVQSSSSTRTSRSTSLSSTKIVSETSNKRITKREQRSQEQKQKFDELPATHPWKKFNFTIMKDEPTISKLWEKAVVEIQEVKESLCIVLQLPNIQKLHIGIENHGKRMKIEAKRFIRNKSASSSSAVAIAQNLFSTDSTNYNAEFVLDGDINVTSKDIYHEYFAEFGLLYIYVENICLDKEFVNSKVAGLGGESNSVKQMLGSFKNNFLRIFGK